MIGYIDTHTHITNEELDLDLYKKEIDHAKNEGLIKSLVVFTEKEELKLFDEMKKDPYFDFAVGIFPTFADKVSSKDFKDLKELAKDERFVAIGEIGLDYYWAKESKEIQKEVFIKQIEIANELNKPIIIHIRDAMGDALEILKEYKCNRKGIIHCFSGSKEMALEFVKLGYYIAFGGTLTFKNNVHGKEALKALSLDQILCETDAPYLTPVPKRGQRNETANVKLVYKFIADYLNIDENTLIEKVKANYERLMYENK